MVKTVAGEETIVSATSSPSVERIAERKTIVYETRVDETVMKVSGEKLKAQLFAKFGFVRPHPDEIRLVSISKYYEPYMVISGKYFIDYYRKCAYTVKVDKKVREVILLDRQFKPSQPSDPASDRNVIKLDGEERLINEAKTSLILDKSGQEVAPDEFPSAPSERNPRKILMAFGAKELAADADTDIVRSRILKRPEDMGRLVSELFEVSERAVIYTPRYRVLYRNTRTGEEKTAEFDGVTAERIQRGRPLAHFLQKLA